VTVDSALPPSTLLVPGRTLLFLPSLVSAIGLNEAIALQQVRYRLADERAPRVWEGKRWVRASVQTWQQRDLPFWSIKTVQRTFESLERKSLVITSQPDLARRDGTKWYTINFTALEPLARMIAGRNSSRTAVVPPIPSDMGALPPLPANDLLIAEHPLVILVDLAVQVGLDEAIILQQLRYWLADERKPPIRDGQRWVCPRDIAFFGPMTHRSPAVLERTLRRLEQAGLIHASARYNTMPGDRTKWYTLNFGAIEQLVAKPGVNLVPHQMNDLTKSKPTECPTLIESNDQLQSVQLSNANSTSCPTPGTRSDHRQLAEVTNPLKGSETKSQTKSQTDQQQHDENVVVFTLEQSLRERGINATVAQRLCTAIAAEIITRQLDIYDWLKEQQMETNHAIPGRLRRMIEEDWLPPREYRTALDRAQDTRARAAVADQRAANTAAMMRELEVQREARAEIIEELGLDSADQRRWSAVVAASPVLPSPFREAFFHAPTPGSAESALIIFADNASKARAFGAAHRAARATIAARLAGLCRRPGLRVAYTDLAELREAMNRSEDDC